MDSKIEFESKKLSLAVLIDLRSLLCLCKYRYAKGVMRIFVVLV